ncbi:hypothetical protein WA026_022908 [Henosepilachna vigintioctopunctata]|uniref:Uncharacterized protein n=1 Tax=Henosepilachna vigintioctopunctata TaxID=420089 RepID=A0AAW1U0K1_9CUCU
MEEDKLKCIFCKKAHDKIKLFNEDTFKKCEIVLKQRIIHNLKFGDVLLPDVLFDNGFHRKCYKHFTALPKKCYSAVQDKQKNATEQNLSNIVESTSFASTSSIPSNPTSNNDPCPASTSSQQNNSTVSDSDVQM